MMQGKDKCNPQSELTTANAVLQTVDLSPTILSQFANVEEHAKDDPIDDYYKRSSSDSDELQTTREVDGNARNPSPPLELIQAGLLGAGDVISGTAVSERWILQIMMNLAKAVNKAEDESQLYLQNDETVCELDSELESDFCLLWDSSVEKEVVLFLLKLPTVNIFIDALTCTWLPRLTEIIIGISGNMAYVDEGCDVLSRNERFCKSLLTTLDSNDPPTLRELFRAYLTFLRNEASRYIWLKYIEDDGNFLPRLSFIARSSTNGLLLNGMAKLIDFSLEINDNFCTSWASEDFVTALLEATQENLYNELKQIGTYYHILHSMSTSDRGKEAIESQHEIVIKSVCSYFDYALGDNFFDVEAQSIGFASGLSLIQMLFTTNSNWTLDLLAEGNAMGFMVKLLTCLSANHTSDRKTHAEVAQDKLLSDSFCTLAKNVLSSSKGINFFLHTLNPCKDIVESLNCLVAKPNGKEFIDRLHYIIHSS